jgi:ABC-2 type transport system ATP-binding protein
VLQIERLTKSYGDHTVLKGVDLAIRPGEVVGLLGPNGAGKTTLVSIVAGLRSADGGTVRIDGFDALRHPERTRQILGLAPQELGIYPTLSVESNLRYFGELSGLRGSDLLTRVRDVSEFLDLTPMLPKRASKLSGGQKRRLHTAMALVHRPKLLFLDEPTVGADIRSRGQILDLVKQLASDGCAVCYATHYLPEVEAIGDSVALIEDGSIIARSSVDELIATHGSAAIRITFEGEPPEMDGFEREGSTLTKQCSNPAVEAGAILRRLGPSAGSVREIDIIRPSLEAAYLALTGRLTNEENVDVAA